MTSLEVQEKLGPALSRIAAGLEGAERVRVSRAMGSAVRLLLVGHFTTLAGSRHTTAQRLGATPTGYLESLAENFDQTTTVAVDEGGVSLTMRHPAISRALRDITITPKNGQFLTIPLNALAYGRRVGEFEKFRLVRKGEGGGSAEKKAAPAPFDNSIPAWLLVRSVTQRRDPSLLPAFDEINTAAAHGAASEIKALLSESGRL